MTDETNEQETAEENPTGDVPGNQTERTFTQAEVDAIVQKRVRSKDKEISALKEQYKAFDDFDAGQLEKYKKVVEADLENAKKTLPDAVTKLLAKLDPLEQLEWLADPENVKPVERKTIPNTPNPDEQVEETESHVKLPFGLGG